MGLLSNDYYANLIKDSAPQPPSTPASPPDSATPQPAEPSPSPDSPPVAAAPVSLPGKDPNSFFIQNSPKPLPTPGQDPVSTPSVFEGEKYPESRTPEQQTALFGGPVGSPEYYKALADHPYMNFLPKQIAGSLGIQFPDQETWDKMSTDDQNKHVIFGALQAGGKMLADLPRQVIRAPISFGYSMYDAMNKFAHGKTGWDDFKDEKPLDVPLIGPVQSYWGSYNDAVKSGVGKLAAGFLTGSQALGDITIMGSVANDIVHSFQPRGKLKPGEQVTNTGPVKQALVKGQGEIANFKAPDSANEYYDTRGEIAKQYGGNPGNMKWKFSPTSDGGTQISLVKLAGKGAKGVDVAAGDFGPERTIWSQKAVNPGTTTDLNTTPSKVYYHGTRVENFDPNSKDVLFLADDKGVAENYANGGGGGRAPGEISAINVEGDIYQHDPQAGGFISPDGKEVISKSDAQEMFKKYQASPVFEKSNVKEVALDPNKKILDLTFKGHDTGEMTTYPELNRTRRVDPETKTFIETLEELKSQKSGNPEQQRVISVMLEQTKNYGFDWGRTTNEYYQKTFSQVIGPALEKKGYGGIKFWDDMHGTTMAFSGNYKLIENGKMPSFESSVVEPSQITIPSAPVKGFEAAPITPDQLGTLSKIGKVNALDSSMQDTLIKAITGKDAVGELTQAEYVRVAKSMGAMSDAAKYSPSMPMMNLAAKAFSPNESFFDSVEKSTGIPLSSKVRIPMENAGRFIKIGTEKYFNQLDELFGKYKGDNFTAERGAVGAYLRGDTNAINLNPSLTPEVKADLLEIAGKYRSWIEKTGNELGVPSDIFIKNYLSNIRNLGGVYHLYKSDFEIPSGYDFFAKQKRTGSISPLVDDPLAIGHIYAKNGLKALYYDPVVKAASEVGKNIEGTPYAGALKNYVSEKLGYEDQVGEWLNKVAGNLNQKMGWNLPADTARQLTQYILDTTYSGAMGINPNTYIRNLITHPVFTYIDQGGDFYAQAVAKALTKEGRQAVQDAGFHVQHGVPYGAALDEDSNLLGKFGNKYKTFTQSTLEGQYQTDTISRDITFHQVDMKFDNAIGNFNAGKWTWDKVENYLDFDGMSTVNANNIRQLIASGDLAGAKAQLQRTVIDSVNYPYRLGAGSQLTYGFAGHTAMQFTTWTTNYVHMLGRMVKYGQWDKIIRFVGANTAVLRSLQDLGVNYKDSVGESPAFPAFSPTLKSVNDFMNLLQAVKSNNSQQIDQNAAKIVQTLKSLGMPAGVEINRAQNFWKSYNAGPIGPGGKYPVYDSKGSLRYYASFSDILFQLGGLPTNESVANRDLTNDLYNAQNDYSVKQQHAVELMQAGKYDEMAKYMRDNNVQMPASTGKKANVPANQRIFEQLPAPLKGDFAPRVFPSTQ